MKIRSTGDKVFDGINYTLLAIVLCIVAFPLLFVLAASISSPDAVVTGKVWFWPVGLNISAYNQIFQQGTIMSGYKNTIIYTVVGTVINLIMTTCAAYPLSRRDFAGRGFFMMAMVFTMYFSGGLIPSFLNIRDLGMIDTLWVMVIPGAISTYNVIIMKTFFQNTIPAELHEAATIDGCSNLRTLVSIILPLSKPVMSVMVLFYAVGHWNAYFNAMIYLTTASKFPLQIILRDILILKQPLEMQGLTEADLLAHSEQLKRGELLKYAIIVVANLPILLIYPLLQKYFVHGMMIGSVKG